MSATLVHLLFLAVLPITVPPGSGAEVTPPKGPPPAAASWLSKLTPVAAGTFPLPSSFEATYRITWSDLEAARADVRLISNDADPTIRTTVKTATVGAARLLFKFDASSTAVADRLTLRPVKLDQTEDRSGKRVNSHVIFTLEGAIRTVSDPQKDAKTPLHGEPDKTTRVRRIDYPGVTDIHCALLRMRSLPLANGDEKTLIVMSATTPYLATIKVITRERVKVGVGDFPAIVCSVGLQKITKRGELEAYKSLKEAKAWISDDANRMVLKISTQIFIGTVELELEKVHYSAPKPPSGG